MENFIALLAGLLPFKTYILTAVALFILIGIAGGGKIVVKDLVVGELKLGARCTSVLTGFGGYFHSHSSSFSKTNCRARACQHQRLGTQR